MWIKIPYCEYYWLRPTGIKGGGGKTLTHKMWIICQFILNPSLKGLKENGSYFFLNFSVVLHIRNMYVFFVLFFFSSFLQFICVSPCFFIVSSYYYCFSFFPWFYFVIICFSYFLIFLKLIFKDCHFKFNSRNLALFVLALS